MEAITGSKVTFQYGTNKPVTDQADFVIEAGKMTVILGKNGSGKSTLVKLILALLPLSAGRLTIRGFDISTPEGIRSVREHCGAVFQNPDNQFISPVVADDIRFGLDNHGVPESEQEERIRLALADTDLAGFEKRNIASLSGGQKQRAAVAGILAMRSDILIFDEAVSMLDQEGKAGLLRCLEERRLEGKTVIYITQNTEEAVNADRVLLLSEGKIAAAGTPREVLTDAGLLERCGVRLPFPVRVYRDLARSGIRLERCPLTEDELKEDLCSLR